MDCKVYLWQQKKYQRGSLSVHDARISRIAALQHPASNGNGVHGKLNEGKLSEATHRSSTWLGTAYSRRLHLLRQSERVLVKVCHKVQADQAKGRVSLTYQTGPGAACDRAENERGDLHLVSLTRQEEIQDRLPVSKP